MLRMLVVSAGALVLAACGGSSSTAPGVEKGVVYGEGVSDGPTMKVSEVLDRAAELNGKRVRVEGVVTDVCAKRGCWIRLAPEEGGPGLTFKVQDGVMVFPMSAKGKQARVEGVVRRVQLDLERTRTILQRRAEEKGETFDPASVTEPGTIVRLDGIGAEIRGRP